jgi:hypothetical protein
MTERVEIAHHREDLFDIVGGEAEGLRRRLIHQELRPVGHDKLIRAVRNVARQLERDRQHALGFAERAVRDVRLHRFAGAILQARDVHRQDRRLARFWRDGDRAGDRFHHHAFERIVGREEHRRADLEEQLRGVRVHGRVLQPHRLAVGELGLEVVVERVELRQRVFTLDARRRAPSPQAAA